MSANKPTFLVTRVGEPVTSTHSRKDGSGDFTVTKTPLTLMATPDSGLNMDVSYTYWATSKTVVEKATAGVAHPSQRLALENPVADFVFGEIKLNTWKTKDGEDASGEKCAVWFQEKVEAIWGKAPLLTSRENGNIADIMFSTVQNDSDAF